MWGQLLRLGLILGLPYLLARIIGLFKALFSWKKYVVFYNPKSLLEKSSLAILVALIGRMLLSIASPEQHYFAMTRTDINSPAYMIRNKFREYVKTRGENDPIFREMIKLRNSHVKESTDSDVLGKIYTSYTHLEKEHAALEKMSIELRNNESRRLVVLFGPDVLNCELCNDLYSRIGLIAPTILKDYLLSLVVIGLVTTSPIKYRWRGYIVLILGIFLAYESYECFQSDSTKIELSLLLRDENYLTKPEQLALTRHIMLAIVLSLVFILDLPMSESPMLVKMKKICEAIEISSTKIQASRLSRMAAMQDDNLRKHSWEYYRMVSKEANLNSSDPEYKKLQLDLGRKYNLDRLLKDADSQIATTFDTLFPST